MQPVTNEPTMNHGNLHEDAESPSTGERFDSLLRLRNLHIERIISSRDIQQAQQVQEQDEWVLLVQGTACLVIDGKPTTLKAGDHVFLPARTPHTVTEASQGAMWLAIHLHPGSPA